MTIAESLRWAANNIAQSDSPRLDAEVLLCHVLKCERSYLYTWPERELSNAQNCAFQTLVARRQQGEPVAYIAGVQEFWSLPLEVNPSTLIPRPDTELLVEVALELPLPDRAAVLDLGTGTGAIALALASEKKGYQIDAADFSVQAVQLAQRNCERLGITNVTVQQSHWYQTLADKRYHLIVSNPPYIDSNDPHLCQGGVRFEPRSALVADSDGMGDIAEIARGALSHLNPGGWILLEHGYGQGAAVRQCLLDNGFMDVETRRDLAGHERATLGQLEPQSV